MGAIIVTGLGKAYKQYPTRLSRLAEWILPGTTPRSTLKWVLKGIDFTVGIGEAVGIIGINGAGKSTLLKMIAGTTKPTTGGVEINGRVAALLELGMGFHPDFTGRQNVFMAAQLLGYNVEEVARLMPEIEAFAEVGDYIDQPVRVYSSGMQMRLAFSVATAHRPDVLIVDEALSVGDMYFQHKSFDRIRAFRKQGTTLLMVSHDKGAIQSICDRVILLDGGKLAMQGEPEVVMDYYNALLGENGTKEVAQVINENGKIQTISGSREATIGNVLLLNDSGESIDIVSVGQNVNLQISVSVAADIPELVIGYMIKDRLGQSVFGTNAHHLKHSIESISAGATVTCSFRFAVNLGEGSYSIAIALHTADTHIDKNYEWRDLALVFNVVNLDKEYFVGVAWLPPVMTISKVEKLDL